MAQGSFQPQQPLVCDDFENCQGRSRAASMDGEGVDGQGRARADPPPRREMLSRRHPAVAAPAALLKLILIPEKLGCVVK